MPAAPAEHYCRQGSSGWHGSVLLRHGALIARFGIVDLRGSHSVSRGVKRTIRLLREPGRNLLDIVADTGETQRLICESPGMYSAVYLAASTNSCKGRLTGKGRPPGLNGLHGEHCVSSFVLRSHRP